MRLWKRVTMMLLIAMLLIGMLPGRFALEVRGTQTDASGEVQVAPTEEKKTISRNSNVDYSELKLKIAMVNGLTSYDYTADTWAKLQEAYTEGKRALDSLHGQQTVDKAVKVIDEALEKLVPMNYTQLENALAEVYALIKENTELHDAWAALDAAVAESKALLVSGDQEKVDQAAERIGQLLERRKQSAGAEQAPSVVVQEVEVEVPPTEDFCNIPMHRMWMVLFLISAVLNVILAVVIGYILTKKKNTTDNTPLVSYDIDDDMDLF